MKVDLTRAEWDQVWAILIKAPWEVANPLLVKISHQLQAPPSVQMPEESDIRVGNGRAIP